MASPKFLRRDRKPPTRWSPVMNKLVKKNGDVPLTPATSSTNSTHVSDASEISASKANQQVERRSNHRRKTGSRVRPKKRLMLLSSESDSTETEEGEEEEEEEEESKVKSFKKPARTPKRAKHSPSITPIPAAPAPAPAPPRAGAPTFQVLSAALIVSNTD